MRKIITFIILCFILVFIPTSVFAFNPSYRFTDQELDPESGLYYFGAREYSPQTGRFLQQDPVLTDPTNDDFFLKKNKDELNEFLSNPQRLNTYSYVLNNPIKYTDPTGESEWWAWASNPFRTAAAVSAWKMVSDIYLKPRNWNISSAFLEQSLKLRIGNNLDMNIKEDSDKYNVINTIKQSNDYKAFIQDRINKAEEKGFKEINFAGGEGTANPDTYLVFNGGDLGHSIHNSNIYINGTKLDNGQWDLNIRLYDKYDYRFTTDLKKYKDDVIGITGNNLATISQYQGAISNYNINIQFNDKW